MEPRGSAAAEEEPRPAAAATGAPGGYGATATGAEARDDLPKRSIQRLHAQRSMSLLSSKSSKDLGDIAWGIRTGMFWRPVTAILTYAGVGIGFTWYAPRIPRCNANFNTVFLIIGLANIMLAIATMGVLFHIVRLLRDRGRPSCSWHASRLEAEVEEHEEDEEASTDVCACLSGLGSLIFMKFGGYWQIVLVALIWLYGTMFAADASRKRCPAAVLVFWASCALDILVSYLSAFDPEIQKVKEGL